MKNLIGVMLLVAATQTYAQPVEADLDGNASALQASEMKPRSQTARRPAPVASQAKKGSEKLTPSSVLARRL